MGARGEKEEGDAIAQTQAAVLNRARSIFSQVQGRIDRWGNIIDVY
jgi:hypothetical protein